MKIYASKRRDEILKRKAEFDEDYKRRKDEFDAQYKSYQEANHAVYQGIVNEVESLLSGVNLDLELSCTRSWEGSIEFRVLDDRHLNQDSKSLSWSWEVNLSEDGEIKKESSSWSGLRAVTEENLSDLEEVVKALKILNNADWKTILDKSLPSYNDYITVDSPERYPKPDFNRELLEADVQDAIDAGYLIKGQGYKYFRPGADVYYRVVGQSAKQYKVQEIYAGYLSKGEDLWADYEYAITKEKFYEIIDKPVETLDEYELAHQ